jgi:hypothetical protein
MKKGENEAKTWLQRMERSYEAPSLLSFSFAKWKFTIKHFMYEDIAQVLVSIK